MSAVQFEKTPNEYIMMNHLRLRDLDSKSGFAAVLREAFIVDKDCYGWLNLDAELFATDDANDVKHIRVRKDEHGFTVALGSHKGGKWDRTAIPRDAKRDYARVTKFTHGTSG